MKLYLRKFFDALVRLLPTFMLRGFIKTYAGNPDIGARCGFDTVPRVFYSPVPLAEEINKEELVKARALPGIDLRIGEAQKLLIQLIQFAPEIAKIPHKREKDCPVWLDNLTYDGFDACTLYAMLRMIKPKRYIEVGCGFSSRFSIWALAQNEREGSKCESHFVEPFPSANFLEQKLPGTFHHKRIQDMPVEFFSSLESGDVLFIDTSHVLKTQSDVVYELLQVLPSLKPGVWVHIHDIFTPYDYPMEWVFCTPRVGNNEQYAVECLLSGGNIWQVELPVHLLWRDYRSELEKLVPGAPDSSGAYKPAAFWVRKTS
jgi:hypothetical protein